MNSVAPSLWLTTVSRSISRCGKMRDNVPPRKLCNAGRGRSVGSVNNSGAPESCAFQ